MDKTTQMMFEAIQKKVDYCKELRDDGYDSIAQDVYTEARAWMNLYHLATGQELTIKAWKVVEKDLT